MDSAGSKLEVIRKLLTKAGDEAGRRADIGHPSSSEHDPSSATDRHRPSTPPTVPDPSPSHCSTTHARTWIRLTHQAHSRLHRDQRR